MKVYEDAHALVFMDIAGDVDGHMIAIPKKHVKSILDCDEENLVHLTRAVKKVATHCVDRCGYEGVNLLNASDESAGQSVPHLHIHIIPRKGEYLLLDRQTGGYVERTIFQLPGKLGKGVLVSPTIHGNTLVGPTALEQYDRLAVNTTYEGMNELMEKAGDTVGGIPFREVITSFAGVRAHEEGGDFILGVPEDAPFFYDCAGIESPGLTAAPAIGRKASEDLAEMLGLKENPAFQPKRQEFKKPFEMSKEEYRELIKKDPSYGRIVCRCESVTEGEIRDAIRRRVGAKSLDGVKRRVRAGMGRCQSGFCSPRVMEILAEELNIPV